MRKLPATTAAGALGRRVASQAALKASVLLGLALGICIPYFGLQSLARAPVWSPPATWLDRLVPFDPRWTAVYLSVCALVPLFPLLARHRDALTGFARGLVWLCVPSFLCFALVPVAGPRPELATSDAAYRWLVGVDAPTNAFPSLHAALAVFCLGFGWRVVGTELPRAARPWFAALLVLWGGAILYATLATKQHFAWDLAAGIALAALALRARALRSRPAVPHAAAPPTGLRTRPVSPRA